MYVEVEQHEYAWNRGQEEGSKIHLPPLLFPHTLKFYQWNQESMRPEGQKEHPTVHTRNSVRT